LTTADTPPSRKSPQARAVTIAEVKARCRDLPLPQRHRFSFDVPDARDAAILVPVVEIDSEAGVVVTLRPDSMTYHRGDWVFPGGRVDPDDPSIAYAAHREACEELGVPETQLEVVGQLDSYGPISTGFVIHTFVGIVQPGTVLDPDPDEVADVVIVPFSALLDPATLRIGSTAPEHFPGPIATATGTAGSPGVVPEGPGRRSTGLPFFTIGPGAELWGTQADIVINLLDVLVGSE
jgi:8-oxo-dGTP pyrophosphatase MutT (NUDIX family)